jgi:hypothetical protein
VPLVDFIKSGGLRGLCFLHNVVIGCGWKPPIHNCDVSASFLSVLGDAIESSDVLAEEIVNNYQTFIDAVVRCNIDFLWYEPKMSGVDVDSVDVRDPLSDFKSVSVDILTGEVISGDVIVVEPKTGARELDIISSASSVLMLANNRHLTRVEFGPGVTVFDVDANKFLAKPHPMVRCVLAYGTFGFLEPKTLASLQSDRLFGVAYIADTLSNGLSGTLGVVAGKLVGAVGDRNLQENLVYSTDFTGQNVVTPTIAFIGESRAPKEVVRSHAIVHRRIPLTDVSGFMPSKPVVLHFRRSDQSVNFDVRPRSYRLTTNLLLSLSVSDTYFSFRLDGVFFFCQVEEVGGYKHLCVSDKFRNQFIVSDESGCPAQVSSSLGEFWAQLVSFCGKDYLYAIPNSSNYAYGNYYAIMQARSAAACSGGWVGSLPYFLKDPTSEMLSLGFCHQSIGITIFPASGTCSYFCQTQIVKDVIVHALDPDTDPVVREHFVVNNTICVGQIRLDKDPIHSSCHTLDSVVHSYTPPGVVGVNNRHLVNRCCIPYGTCVVQYFHAWWFDTPRYSYVAGIIEISDAVYPDVVRKFHDILRCNFSERDIPPYFSDVISSLVKSLLYRKIIEMIPDGDRAFWYKWNVRDDHNIFDRNKTYSKSGSWFDRPSKDVVLYFPHGYTELPGYATCFGPDHLPPYKPGDVHTACSTVLDDSDPCYQSCDDPPLWSALPFGSVRDNTKTNVALETADCCWPNQVSD